MKGLIIDTSAKNVLCIAFDGEAVSVQDCVPDVNTSTSVIPAIDAALVAVGLHPAQLQLVAAVIGPGSFTGLRICVSVANAMGTLGGNLLPVNVLDVLAHAMPKDTLCAVLARTGFCYTNRGELPCELVAQDSQAIGLEGSGAPNILDRTQYVQRLLAYVLCHADEATDQPLAPLYLKKSKAERVKEGLHD